MSFLYPYYTRSAVLFIIFNRPDTTEQVFEKIKEAKPPKLYIAADGPRKSNIKDETLCRLARQVVEDITWDCEVKILFRQQNLGCKYAISSAISWFFEQEEEGIILEDDCFPSNDFFRFCDEMLARYRFDTRIRHITGCNLQEGKKWGAASYYFSNNIHVWGWAGWKRVWGEYDPELGKYKEYEVEEQFNKIFQEPLLTESWKDIFIKMKNQDIDTWDYQLGIINFFNNGLCIIPNVNLVSNIGFRPDATHTVTENGRHANIPHQELDKEISHPKYILPEKQADIFTWNLDFDIEARKAKNKTLKNRIKKWLKN